MPEALKKKTHKVPIHSTRLILTKLCAVRFLAYLIEGNPL